MSVVPSLSLKISSSNNWEGLCPELFALVLKAVQQNARQHVAEARRIVALAGVCRRWRWLIQQFYTSPLGEIGLLQFPFVLRQPGPCHRPVQCLLKRKGKFTVLFQDNEGRGEKLDFLMAARKEWKPSGTSYIISASHKCFSPSSHAYMGKLKSDFWASEFLLWEVSGSQQKYTRQAIRINFFERRVEGGLKHRAMCCELFLAAKNSRSLSNLVDRESSRVGMVLDRPTNFLRKWTCLSGGLPASSSSTAAATFLRSYSSIRRSGKIFERNNSKAGSSSGFVRNGSTRSREASVNNNATMTTFESKTPNWDDHRQCWSLNFHGRSTLPSNYSFQLVQSNAQGHEISAEAHEADQEEQTIFLQLGKVGKGLYTMDFRHPLSAFQAFAICLSSFATKVGLEP